MARKPLTEEQKQVLRDRLAKARAAKAKTKTPLTQTEDEVFDKTDFQEPEINTAELAKQVKEANETIALLKAALLGGNNDGLNVGRKNQVVGEIERYSVDLESYPDPTKRLAKEPRLAPLAFDYNYELAYEALVRSYETKTGLNMKEPEFKITLNRVVLDDQGRPTDKRYIARKLIFHEDPQAALIVARENNLPVDQSDEKLFLDEMRYIRVRDWLFDIFWPQPAVYSDGVREEVIGGQLVQVFTKSSVDSAEIPFSDIKSKVV